jgi:hypothetical protein
LGFSQVWKDLAVISPFVNKTSRFLTWGILFYILVPLFYRKFVQVCRHM